MATLWNGNFFYNMCKGTNEKLKMWTDEVWKINETLTEYNTMHHNENTVHGRKKYENNFLHMILKSLRSQYNLLQYLWL